MNHNPTAHQVLVGTQIEPIQRIQIMSPEEWEILVEEWLEIKESSYIKIERLGGAGDMGRDVVAYIDNPQNNPNSYNWDCYQCKHYAKSLSPSEIWVEFGKLIYHTFNKKFPVPNNYYFVAPKSIGTSLSNLLNNPIELKESLRTNWIKYCENKISDKKVYLTGIFLEYFNKFNFSIFGNIPPKVIVQDHKKHENHLQTFGGGLPSRENVVDIPPLDKDVHLRYISQLTKAYNSDSSSSIESVEVIIESKYNPHFTRSRKSFHNAEELRAFTRDNLPSEVYDKFKEEIYESVVNLAEDNYKDNGFKKIKAVENQATTTKVESNPIREVCTTIDKKGVCHQLVNDNLISWVDDD